MSEHAKPLLVVTTSTAMTREAIEKMKAALQPVLDQAGMAGLVLTDGMQASLEVDLRPLLVEQIEQQKKTNLLLASLIEAMADEDDMVERPLRTYLNGDLIPEPAHVEFVRKR